MRTPIITCVFWRTKQAFCGFATGRILGVLQNKRKPYFLIEFNIEKQTYKMFSDLFVTKDLFLQH